MMTLRNLQQMVDKADLHAAHEKITAKTVRESGADIIASVTTSDGSMLRVYDNGYVVYSNGLRVTVFPLHDITGDYYYQTQMDSGRPDMIIKEDEILSMPWYLGVLMKAEDRIVHSQNNSKTNGYLILDGLMSELSANKEDESCDALELLIMKETYQENALLLKRALDQVTEKQRKVLIDYYFRYKKQNEIAAEMKITQQGVSDICKRALAKMLKIIGEDNKPPME